MAQRDQEVPPLTDEIRDAQILGLTELAAFMRVPRATVHVWNYREHLPPADYPSVNNNVAWRRLTIVQWAASSGRVREDSPAWFKEEAERWKPPGGVKRKRRTKAEMEAARAVADV